MLIHIENDCGGIIMNKHKEEKHEQKASAKAFLPFLVFIGLSLGSGVILGWLGYENAFAAFPAIVAVYLACCFGLVLFKGTMQEKINVFMKGAAQPNIINMCIVFIVAGGFAALTKELGSADAVANLCLQFLPFDYVAAGVFIVGCLISVSSGTSMGTVVALTPIALSLVAKTNVQLPVMLGAVLSGAMFGNNLSPVSSATVATVNTLEVSTAEKTKQNAILAIPALVAATALFIIFGKAEGAVAVQEYGYSFLKIVPYITILILAVKGVSVLICLSVGIFVSCIIGFIQGEVTIITLAQITSEGFLSMAGMVFLSIFIGGLVYMVEQEGGITFVVQKLERYAKSKKSAELACSVLIFFIAGCIANDTLACIVGGNIAKKISKTFQTNRTKMAVLVEIIACTVVVIIPYSGLMLSMYSMVSMAGYSINFTQVVPYTFYPLVLTGILLLSIFVPYEKLLLKNKNYQK